MTFSFIVPIYNAERTLQRCLDSILFQTYPSYEVLMIDDGSLDKSSQIAASYEEKDSRFKLIIQPNAGPSRARNCGLNMAKGDWISFVDSDDYIECDYLQQIVSVCQAKATQIVFFGVNQIVDNVKKSVRNITDLPQNRIDQIITLTNADLLGYTWIKAISRQLIGQTRFDETLNLFEDEVFTCQIMQKQPTISWINKPLYNQIVLSGSLSRRVHQDYYDKCEAVYLAWKQLFLSFNIKNHQVLQEKANHMSNVCKYYFLERSVSPVQFIHGLGRCSFFLDSTVDDSLVAAIKNGKQGRILIKRYIYRCKLLLAKLISR